jgi:hypothetical protein
MQPVLDIDADRLGEPSRLLKACLRVSPLPLAEIR